MKVKSENSPISKYIYHLMSLAIKVKNNRTLGTIILDKHKNTA